MPAEAAREFLGPTRFTVDVTQSGPDQVGDIEWTNSHWKVTGFFDNPTTVSGTYLRSCDANYKGTHYRCSSGEIRWSATRRS
jgi:hypothetical protein